MPVQLYNYSKSKIVIIPYLSVCQLILIPLSSPPDKAYADKPNSKYMNEDGIPSRWYWDTMVENLQKSISKSDISKEMQNDLITKISSQPIEIQRRFQKFLETKCSKTKFENTDSMLNQFVKNERNEQRKWAILKYGGGIVLFFIALYGFLSKNKITHLLHLPEASLWVYFIYLTYVALCIFLVCGVEYLNNKNTQYLTDEEMLNKSK